MKAGIFCVFTLVLVTSPGYGWLFGSSGSGGRSSSSSLPRDIDSGSGLRTLYNTRVVQAERVQRPLGGSSSGRYPLSHTGVRITDANGMCLTFVCVVTVIDVVVVVSLFVSSFSQEFIVAILCSDFV